MSGSGQVLANFVHPLLIWNMHILWIKTPFWIAMLANFVIREEEEWKETYEPHLTLQNHTRTQQNMKMAP